MKINRHDGGGPFTTGPNLCGWSANAVPTQTRCLSNTFTFVRQRRALKRWSYRPWASQSCSFARTAAASSCFWMSFAKVSVISNMVFVVLVVCTWCLGVPSAIKTDWSLEFVFIYLVWFATTMRKELLCLSSWILRAALHSIHCPVSVLRVTSSRPSGSVRTVITAWLNGEIYKHWVDRISKQTRPLRFGKRTTFAFLVTAKCGLP